MAEYFAYDVFLSHSSHDKDVGLERSRVLVLCMSASAFGSEWAQLEAGVFRFRDPLNKERRFIPLRLDETPAPGSLAPLLYVDWTATRRGEQFEKLREACGPALAIATEDMLARQSTKDRTIGLGHTTLIWSVALSADGRRAISGSADSTVRLWDVESGCELRVFEGHSGEVNSVALSADGRRAISGSDDKTVRLWDVESGRELRVFKGHSGYVRSVVLSADGRRALSGSDDETVRLWDVESGRELRVFEGHSDTVMRVALSADGRRAISGADDKTMRLWDVESGRELRVFEGHSGLVRSVALSADGRRALSGSEDKTMRLWDVESGRELRVFEGHSGYVRSVALSADGRRAISGSDDKTVRLWDVESGRELRVFEGHSGYVRSVVLSADGRRAISGSDDETVRLWDVESGRELRVFKGHSSLVRSVALSADGRRAISGSDDETVRLWDVESGRELRVFEGHSGSVRSVALSADGRRAISGSDDETVRLWDVESGRELRVFKGHSGSVWSVALSAAGRGAYSAALNGVLRIWELGEATAESAGARDVEEPKAHLQYTNAKVLLVGESGAGKTGLSQRLTSGAFTQSSVSTVGAASEKLEWATHMTLGSTTANDLEREIWLWDFGGQADQRLIHQLYMDDTALAVFVFDGQRDDCFEKLAQWDRDLMRASRRPFTKLLAAGRVDASRVRASADAIATFAKSRAFVGPLFETSALTGQGCAELKQAVIDGVDWENIPSRTSPAIFKRLKDEIVRMKDEAKAPGGRLLLRFNELRDALRLRMAGETTGTGKRAEFTDEQLGAVLDLLKGPGVVWRLEFGGWVLLRPEAINAYAQAVIQTLADDAKERGCVMEERVLRGDLRYKASMERLGEEDERFALQAMYQTLVERGLCLKEATGDGPVLIFPSYYRRERPEPVGQPNVLMTYRFTGFLDEIYATLVVRLHHTTPFQHDELWRDAADFKTTMQQQAGLKLKRQANGVGELDVYFDLDVPMDTKMTFTRYVDEHLKRHGHDVVRLRHYVCEQAGCGTGVGNREVAMKKLREWVQGGKKGKKPTIICVNCEKRAALWDQMEERFGSEEIRWQVLEMERQAQGQLDNESKERVLVGEVISTVALAGQIAREFSVSDHGIDMEIEFKDDAGKATGRKVYLQLRSSDSQLRGRKGGEEVFDVSERNARYWAAQPFPTYLVVRNSRGESQWMEVRNWLRTWAEMWRIVFEGERFDVMAVRALREKSLGSTG